MLKYRLYPERYRYQYSRLRYKVRTAITHYKLISVSSLAVSLVLTTIFVHLFETPKDRHLRQENSRLLTQYNILNKRLADVEKVLDDLGQRDESLYRNYFGGDPIPVTVRKQGFGGTNKYAQLENMDNSELVISTNRKLDIVAKQAYIQSKSFDEILALAKSHDKLMLSTPSIQPVSNKDLKHTAGGYGMRMHPVLHIKRFHHGMDFTVPTGTEIFATADGVVERADALSGGFGNHIVINHGFGYKTLYAHLSKYNVKHGQHVKRGEIIGYSGNTGLSSGPHLHYEVHVNGHDVNPIGFYFNDLAPDQYDEIIELANNKNIQEL
ncbi:MAG: M23 family metallopeptidase [Bacteroidales bacterium]|nr:M23 family metallopeptidase [Bacteroidales bacterium]